MQISAERRLNTQVVLGSLFSTVSASGLNSLFCNHSGTLWVSTAVQAGMPANAMALFMPMVHMVMAACGRSVIPRQSGKVLSRRLDGEVHLKFPRQLAKRVRHGPALPAW